MTESYDQDAIETQEWLSALDALIAQAGASRAQGLMQKLLSHAEHSGVALGKCLHSTYTNTIDEDDQPDYPGDLAMEARIAAYIRWNVVAMVMATKRNVGELGGHISSCNSLMTAYEVGLNHFFRGRDGSAMGDFVFFQGHSAEANYARAYLEGRLTADQLGNFRQEAFVDGLSSYPHPWLMPDFWQFPTVSLGLGQMQGVYSARFLRYLEHRGLAQTQGREVYVFCGDGEMDEPEARAALCFAANEGLDNLTFLVNCNLQRLDGLVRSNYKIVDELEGLFAGCGWHVIKVLWGSAWDELFVADVDDELKQRLASMVDGELQACVAQGPAYLREHLFNTPALAALVAGWSDNDILKLELGGHDSSKVYAAYAKARAHTGSPTVILLQGVKGHGLGTAAAGKNIAHNQLTMTKEQLEAFRDRFSIPVSDQQLADLSLIHPGEGSPECDYIHQQRAALGGYVPSRTATAPVLAVPPLDQFEVLLKGSGEREMSTTMALGRMLSTLLKDKTFGKHIVPIFSDEVRTFGMEGLFRQVGIYAPLGQLYESEDHKQLSFYKESKDGQILMEGITEAGCMSSWIAAGTSYSTNGLPMLPIFTYYSMFGFQRVGDFIWAAADSRARGFLIGGTAGRTTLEGEGLQHQDGHSLLIAAQVPNCIAYDPTFGYEMVVILREGIRRMMAEQDDVFFYVMAMNEKYVHPPMPEGCEEGIIKGMYLLQQAAETASERTLTLLGSGTILREAIKAASMLAEDFDVCVNVWSATSFNALAREAAAKARLALLKPEQTIEPSYVETMLSEAQGPVIAVTDYVRAYAEQIRPYVKQDYHVLGTDGFGRSDTRENLRRFFEVDAAFIAYTAVVALVKQGVLPSDAVQGAQEKYQIDPNKQNPLDC
jgi:pyruvate dehydrogenase E1 component